MIEKIADLIEEFYDGCEDVKCPVNKIDSCYYCIAKKILDHLNAEKVENEYCTCKDPDPCPCDKACGMCLMCVKPINGTGKPSADKCPSQWDNKNPCPVCGKDKPSAMGEDEICLTIRDYLNKVYGVFIGSDEESATITMRGKDMFDLAHAIAESQKGKTPHEE